MKIINFIKNKLVISPLKYIVVFVAGLVFSAGLAFAWNAVWHGTDWIQSGQVIRAKEIGENMQYLYEQIEDLKNQISVSTSTSTSTITQNSSCQSLVPNWPDLIKCPGDYRLWFEIRPDNYGYLNGAITYRALDGQHYADNNDYISFNLDGSIRFEKRKGICHNKTMQELIAAGLTYNRCLTKNNKFLTSSIVASCLRERDILIDLGHKPFHYNCTGGASATKLDYSDAQCPQGTILIYESRIQNGAEMAGFVCLKFKN